MGLSWWKQIVPIKAKAFIPFLIEPTQLKPTFFDLDLHLFSGISFSFLADSTCALLIVKPRVKGGGGGWRGVTGNQFPPRILSILLPPSPPTRYGACLSLAFRFTGHCTSVLFIAIIVVVCVTCRTSRQVFLCLSCCPFSLCLQIP